VGGTEFTGDTPPSQFWSTAGAAQSYIPETTWNDTQLVNQLDATGGGLSGFFSKPDWQTATGVPNDGARDVPDIAFNASNTHDPYVLCTGGNTSCSFNLAGGTSFGAPTFAGIVALLNQKGGGTAQGNVNPTLYKVYASTPNAFHDITTGNNIVPCQAGTPDCPSSGSYGYSAGTGYDLVTGLGSLEVTNLVNAWTAANPTAADFHLYAVQASISAPGGTGTSTITVDGVHGFSGAIALTCAAPTSAFISCSVNPGSVTPGGTTNTASATLTINTKAASLDFHQVPLWSSGSGAMLAGVFVFGLSPRRRRLKAAAALAVVAFLIASVGCGGSSSGSKSSGTPAGTYTVSVTATSGSTSHTTNVSVTVI
jgi:subtilase family serine protease